MNKNFILIKANFENIKSLPVSNFGTIQKGEVLLRKILNCSKSSHLCLMVAGAGLCLL